MVRAPVPLYRAKVDKEGRLHRVVMPWLKGVSLHLFNVYGWVSTGSQSIEKNDAMAMDIKEEIGILGRVPWISGGRLE